MARDLEPTQTLLPGPPDDPAMDAALAAAFGAESSPRQWSQPPLLRDDPSDDTPLIRPDSPDMPKGDPGRYQLLGEIARGGMGLILKGRDPTLGRDLAVKVLKAELVGRASAEQRFQEEAQICGQLQHPGMVPVYELGWFADGQPFFTMKLVKGRTLAALLNERSSPSDGRVRFVKDFEKVCQAMAYAHSRGVIHRDLKPSNIMVGNFGEVQVMDWGLAKVIAHGDVSDQVKAAGRESPRAEDEPTVIQTARSGTTTGSHTEVGSVLGTPAYMPPEQAGGEVDKVDERADVFGLGAVLCVILTGKPPYVADTSDAVRLMAIRGLLEDAHTRLDACGADAELIAICKHCLSADRYARPPHARAVADALGRHLTEVENRAQRAEVARASAEAKAAEHKKRRKIQLAFAVAVFAIAGLTGFGLWWRDRQATDRRQEQAVAAAKARQVAETALDQAEAALRADKMPEADAALAVADQRLGDADAQDLRERFAGIKNDREVIRELDDVADQRWALSEDEISLNESKAKARVRYAELFRRYGLAIDGDSAAVAAELVARSRVSAALATGLEEWFFLDPKLPWLAAVIDRLDPDPMRVEVRAAVAAGEHARIRELAGDLDGASLTPGFAVALGGHSVLSNDDGYRLMRAAWDARPDSFPLALRMASRVGGLSQGSEPRDPAQVMEAAAWLRTAIALRPANAVAHNNLGIAIRRLGDWAGAAVAFRRAIQLAPRFALAHRNLAEALVKLNHHEEAVAAAQRSVDITPEVSNSWGALGSAHFARKNYREALVAYRQAAARSPDVPSYHCNVGLCLYRLKDLPGAAASFRKAINVAPTTARYHNELGQVLRDQKNQDGAIESYRQAVHLDPQYAIAHCNLGVALLAKEDTAGAIVSLREAVRIDRRYARAHYNLGRALRFRGDLDGAIASYREALQHDPKYAFVHNNLAWLLATGPEGVRDGKLAVEHARRSCELTDWKDPFSFDTLSAAYAELGDFDKAIEYVKRCLADPALPKAEVKVARAHLDLYLQKKPVRDPTLVRREIGPPPREVKR